MIVFLHGWGMSKQIFNQFVKGYLAGQEVMLLDLPGYGDANWVSDFDHQVTQLAKEIPSGAHLVAWSLAGLYALRMTAMYPSKLSRLTMVSSTPCFAQKIDFKYALSKKLLDQFSQQLVEDRNKTIDRFLQLQLHGQPKASEYVRDIRMIFLDQTIVKKEVLEFGLKCLKEIDCRDELKLCVVPIQFILGGKDKIVPSLISGGISKINRKISVIVLEGAGHIPFITHEKTFYKKVFGLEAL